MTLGINGWRILGERTGVGRYLQSLVRHWDDDLVRSRFSDIALYTPRESAAETPPNIRREVLAPASRMLIWENLSFGPRAAHDVLFCPSFSRPLFARGRTVLTLFEATYKLHPELFPRRHWYSFPGLYLGLYEWSGKNSELVLTTSETAKEDLIRAYGIPRERLRVVYLAPSPIFRPGHRDGGVPFFFNAGKLSPVRNVPKIVEAFARLKREHGIPHQMVFAGPRDQALDFDALVAHHGVEADCRHVGYVSDEELVRLYQSAEAFVLPYEYQTVSLPPLEAMACGTPAIVAGTAGLRETTGGAAIYLGRAEVDDIAEAMLAVATDPAMRNEFSARGLQFTATLSERRTAAETLDILVEAASR